MTLQIHRIMKDAQNLNRLLLLVRTNAEKDKMPTLFTLASDVHGHEPLGDVLALSCTRDRWSDCQSLDRGR